MEYTGYIVLKLYDKDREKVDSPKRLYDTIFLKPEYNIAQEDKTFKPSVLPIYTSQKEAEADADWWPAHTYEDYSVVRKVTIKLEEETYNTIKSERKTLNKLIKDYPQDNLNYKKELKELSWYPE